MTPITISADRLAFLEDGKPWVWRGVTDFALYGRYLNEGAAPVAAVFKNRRAVGANVCRVLGMVSWWPNLTPAHPAYWSSLRPFVALAAAEGLRLEFVVFADAQIIMPDLPSQLAHWERVLVTLGDATNVFFQVSNQGDKNGVPEAWRVQFAKPAPFSQLLCCRDNPMESANPTLPAMDYSAYCASRDDVKGYVEVGSSMHYVVHGWGPGTAWGGTQQVSILDEPIGADETHQPGSRWADPGKFRQLARSLTFKGTGGATFHSTAGTRSALFDVTCPITTACAVEFLGNLPPP